jgi:ribosome-binding factor A
LKLRVIPQLHFIYDESIERGVRLSQLIDEAVASDRSEKETDNT